MYVQSFYYHGIEVVLSHSVDDEVEVAVKRSDVAVKHEVVVGWSLTSRRNNCCFRGVDDLTGDAHLKE